jgi:hypothetical protein
MEMEIEISRLETLAEFKQKSRVSREEPRPTST